MLTHDDGEAGCTLSFTLLVHAALNCLIEHSLCCFPRDRTQRYRQDGYFCKALVCPWQRPSEWEIVQEFVLGKSMGVLLVELLRQKFCFGKSGCIKGW